MGLAQICNVICCWARIDVEKATRRDESPRRVAASPVCTVDESHTSVTNGRGCLSCIECIDQSVVCTDDREIKMDV